MMEVLDFVEAALADNEFDHEGIHVKWSLSEPPITPTVVLTITPHDDSVISEYRHLAFELAQQLLSETTNNDACITTVKEDYSNLCDLIYTVTIEDYLT